jgi:hypothetical protein
MPFFNTNLMAAAKVALGEVESTLRVITSEAFMMNSCLVDQRPSNSGFSEGSNP